MSDHSKKASYRPKRLALAALAAASVAASGAPTEESAAGPGGGAQAPIVQRYLQDAQRQGAAGQSATGWSYDPSFVYPKGNAADPFGPSNLPAQRRPANVAAAAAAASAPSVGFPFAGPAPATPAPFAPSAPSVRAAGAAPTQDPNPFIVNGPYSNKNSGAGASGASGAAEPAASKPARPGSALPQPAGASPRPAYARQPAPSWAPAPQPGAVPAQGAPAAPAFPVSAPAQPRPAEPYERSPTSAPAAASSAGAAARAQEILSGSGAPKPRKPAGLASRSTPLTFGDAGRKKPEDEPLYTNATDDMSDVPEVSVISERAREQPNNSGLAQILREAMVKDPKLLEAMASNRAAQKRAEGTFGLHYPTFQLFNNTLVAQHHKDEKKEQERRFDPGVQMRFNLYSFGSIQNQYLRDKEKERFTYYKYYETREEVGFEIANLYLAALNARESIEVNLENLKRHDKIMSDMEVIVKNDPGRKSEYTQAKAREVQVKQNLVNNQTTLATNLSRLSTLIGRVVTEQELTDPFAEEYGSNRLNLYTLKKLESHPSYLAQAAELASLRKDVEVNRGKTLPSINLEGAATRDDQAMYLNLNWDAFNRPNSSSVAESAENVTAAENRLTQVKRDVLQRSSLAKVQLQQSIERMNVSNEQIEANKGVVNSYELQYKIARKSLIDLLNAYNELSSVEMGLVASKNDFRTAYISYLRSQATISKWANVPVTQFDKDYIAAAQ